MSTQGEHMIGGSMMFKDHILSPLTIHNNTFYKNDGFLSETGVAVDIT